MLSFEFAPWRFGQRTACWNDGLIGACSSRLVPKQAMQRQEKVDWNKAATAAREGKKIRWRSLTFFTDKHLNSQEGKISYMQGVLLHASPPVKHESPMNYQGFEVTKYQPPWKTFSEFAMHNDSDDCTQTPGFQHLVNQVRSKTEPTLPTVSHNFSFPFNSFTATICQMKL